jgi:hypothetical protein
MGRKKVKKTKKQEQKTENYQTPKTNAAKIPLLPIAIILIAVIGVGYFAIKGNKTGFVNAKDVTQKTASSKTNDISFAKLKGGETKSVLSPARFTGKTASAYKVAQEYPELMDAMYCYCYCKKTIGHKSLLSCFTDKHASKCGICQDQAFYAKRMQGKGLDIGQIRKEVDRKFWRPFS